MNKEQLAEILDGAQYGDVVSKDMAATAKANGLVIVYGASDDLMEFEGAIYDEVGCYEGGTAYLTADGLLDEECDSECKYYRVARDSAITIKAIWGEGEYSFQYKTEIPHATFEVFDGEEKYCRGIVFHLDDLKAAVEKRRG